jgi:predicted ATPase/DNA-binding SARP family transcriptional activator
MELSLLLGQASPFPQLRLLGPVEIWRDNGAVALHRKERALLAYLAAAEAPVQRSALTMLLCPLAADPGAALRLLLTRIRAQLGGAALRVTGSAIALGAGALWIDLHAFERLLSAPGAPAEQISAAVDLYRGPFLEDLALADAPEFELWMLGKRAVLQQCYEQALATLVRLALERDDLHEALRRAQQLTLTNPLREAAHGDLIRIYARLGQHSAAVEQFERYQRLLAAELGVAPDAALAALAEEIRGGAWRSQPLEAPQQLATRRAARDRQIPRHNLPADLTSFLGREEELAQLAATLVDPGCRLVTITGPGGVGKTRLALASAREQACSGSPFADGVFFVALAALRPTGVEAGDAALVAGIIAAAIGLPLAGSAPPPEQLISALRDKAMLLVLDNFEHLVGAVGLVHDLLSQAPALTLLVTSRERLQLYGESLFAIAGLALPPDDDDPEAAGYAGIALFVQRAKLADRRFDPAGQLSVISRVCRALSAMPLAIELAAARAPSLGCAALERALGAGLDALATTTRNVPERQRSLRAAFAYSWQLLATEEQESFARLTVFYGGCTADAAHEVAGVAPTMLERLADVSLVQRGADGRYMLHELLRQFGAERLADAPDLQRRHADYFARLARVYERAAANGDPDAVAALEAELGNLSAAWAQTLAHADVGGLSELLEAVMTLHTLRGWLTKAGELLVQARQAFEPAPEAALLVGRLALWQARFAEQLGRYDEARVEAEASRATFERLEAPDLAAQAEVVLGTVLSGVGQNEAAVALLERSLLTFRALGHRQGQAEALYQMSFPLVLRENDIEAVNRCITESLRLSEALGDQRSMARCHYVIGNNAIGSGLYAEALSHYAESSRLSERIGDITTLANCLKNQGMAAHFLGRLDEAEQYVREAQLIFRRIGDERGLANALYNHGEIAVDQGRNHAARELLEESLARFRALGRPVAEAWVLRALGRVQIDLDLLDDAGASLRRCLELSLEAQAVSLLACGLHPAARLLYRRGAEELAVETLAHVIDSATTEARFREQAAHDLRLLAATLPPERLAVLRERGRARDLIALAVEVLGLL